MTRISRLFWRQAALVASLVAPACHAPSVRTSAMIEARVQVHAKSDDDQPLSRVALTRATRALGETPASGLLELTLQGTEGQAVALGVVCPDGFVEQTEPRVVRLASTRAVGSGASAPIKVDVVCERRQRNVVLVVRTTGVAGLPITVNGERAGITDGNGIAHVLVRVARAVRSLEVAFDTQGRRELLGQSNRRLLELGPSDTVLVVDQRFAAKAPRAARSGKTTSPTLTPRAPTRID